MPRAARGRATRSTRSPATFSLDGHIIETYNHIDDLPQHSSLPKKRPRHATRGATAAERRADRQAAAASDPQPNGMVTRSSRQNLLRHSNSTSPLTAPSPSSEPTDNDYPPISCRVCFKSNTPTKIICCSICRKGVHTFCLNPPVMDLPNDSSWKCSKCRRTRLPLKKEARIILRDALSTYSPLCTDNYINAVANVVCVVSDSESPHNKNTPNPPKNPKLDSPHKPQQPPPNDNTVVLRLSTDDSDLDSNVEDDIRPNPAANSDKPQPSRPSNRNQPSKQQQKPATNPSTPVEKNSSLGKKSPPQEEKAPSSSTSFDGDDERPLSQLMSRGMQRRHRHAKAHKSKQTDPSLASPKMRLKAKQRRLREESVELLQLAAGADLKAVRESTSLPPKRRGRKLGTKKVEKNAQETPPQVSGNSEKDTNAKIPDQTKQVEIKTQPIAPIPPVAAAAEPIEMDVKADTVKEEALEPSTAPSKEQNKDTRDVPSEMSDGSASNIDEGYPGDTEDDLPLSKRSARYRKPSSPRSNRENNDKPSLQATNDGPAMKESAPATACPVNNMCDRKPKQEAIIQETTAIPENHEDEVAKPKPAAVGEANPGTPAENPEANPDPEKQSAGSWPQMKLDPKHEALFALARVQRQQPKPIDSPENPVVSLESESSAGALKALPRPKNIPESERQRIQVTALAASNMRRNVSNMASTMAGLRPHSPRVSKGSINLLLQQNQPEAQSDIVAQRSYQPAQDISVSRHSGHLGREEVIQSGPEPHRSDREIAHNTAQVYRGMDPRNQEARRSSGAFPYRDAPAGSDIQAYPIPQHRNVVQSGTFRGVEPKLPGVPPFAKRNRVEEMLPQAKRPRSNKSDISNVLSTDSLIPMNERQIVNKNNRIPRLFPEPGHRESQQAPIPPSTVQVHSSDGPTQPSQAPGPYSLTQNAPQSRYEPPEARPNNFGMRERLTLQDVRMSRNDEGNLGARFPPTGASYPNVPLRNPVVQAESGMQMNAEEDVRHATHRAYDTNRGPLPQVQESGIRTSSQTYPPANIGGDPIPSRLRWPDNNEPAMNAPRQVYSGTNATNQPWSDSRVSSRPPPQQEGSYNATVSRFVPIDRRTRRPMPYVPTATRKAQFEQGRALAFIDSRPVPPNADPSETYRVDDRSPGLTTRPCTARPEGTYSGSEYAFPQSGPSRTTYGDEENRTHTNSYHGDYYVHRQEYRRSSNPERVSEGGPYTRESQRDSLMRENIGSNTRGLDGAGYGQSRLSALQRGQPSSSTILEPPLERNKSLPVDRNEAPPFSSLVGPRVRTRQENEIPSITSTFGTERRAPGTRARSPMERGQRERGYGIGRIQSGDRRGEGFPSVPYSSFHSQRNESMRPPAGSIVDARLPAPIHVDGDHYRARETRVGAAERRFPSSVMVGSGSGSVYGRRADQIGNRYDYNRGSQEGRGSLIPHSMPALDNRNEDFGADRVSNIPLVARYENSLSGYMDSKTIGRSSNDRGSRMNEVPVIQRSDQGQQLPSLRSNPSLRDLLS